jgi:hypothetical protein
LLKNSNISKISFLLVIIGLLLFQYFLQKYFVGIYDFPQKVSISAVLNDITDLKILITKIFKIFMHCFIAFIKYPLWLLVLVSVFIQLFFINKIDNHSKYFLLCLILNLIFIVSIFFTFRNFDFMLKVSLDRLLFQTSGFYIILLLLTIKNLKFFKK